MREGIGICIYFRMFNEVIIYVLLDESEGLRVTSVAEFPPFKGKHPAS